MYDTLGTSAALAPDHDAAHPPLGQLLVERDLLSQDQLNAALAEQERSGLPLGQVLIGLSYVTASTIAQALATQHDIATGFDSDVEEAPAPLEPPAGPEQVHVPPAWIEATVIPLLQPVPELVVMPELVVETESMTRIAALELELASASQEAQLARQELALARQESATADPQTDERELFTAHVRIAELEVDVEATHLALEAANARSAVLDRELTNARRATVNHDACALQVQQLHADLAMTTENLREAYARLHQHEIAAALQQAQQLEAAQQVVQQVVQQPAHTQDTRPASPFAWQT
jgi:hypothetical protein